MAAKKTKIEKKDEKATGFVLGPRVTEKATLLTEKNTYVFNVKAEATKQLVAAEVKRLYKVTPVKVSITNLPKKKVFVRGNVGSKGGVKKAIVFLKKGESIEFA